MVWAPHRESEPLTLCHNGRRVMPADVEEGAKAAIFSANDYDRLARYLGCQVLSGLGDLLDAPGNLPASTENGPSLEVGEGLIEVPRRRDGRSVIE